MIFLKRFRANGFKSYAENIELVFNKPLTGIVGPNGAGKSNVVDALKWVLGERSMKQLRGKSGDDIIFFGSKDRPASNTAEVALTFDNSNKSLHDKRKEITVMRRVHRGSGISEYFINEQPATLKEIADIFLDTGLAKGSLGIISQGTVSWFVEAKPEDRRMIFEEAAGIGRYAKKKEDAIRQLERTADNLKQVTTVVNELSRDLKKLTTQAEKAKIYVQNKEELKELELIILVRDYVKNKNELEKMARKIEAIDANFEKFEPLIKVTEEKLEIAKERYEAADTNVTNLQNDLQNYYGEISQLEQRKVIIDAKLQTGLNSKDVNVKIKSLKQLIKITDEQLSGYYKAVKKLTTELDESIVKLDEVTKDNASKRQSHMDLSNKLYQSQIELDFLKSQKQSELERETGVKSILSNKAALSGIHGIVQDFLNVPQEYEKAISVALGRSLKNVVVDTSQDAQNAIEFLKTNKAGMGTFLPLSEIKQRNVKEEHLEVLNQVEGFVGVAAGLVKFDKMFEPAVSALLGQILIATDLDTAIKVSRFTYQIYRVISLQGDIVAAGGAITGGYRSSRTVLFNADEKIKTLQDTISETNKEINNLSVQIDKISLSLKDLEVQVNERKLSLQRYNDLITNSKKQVDQYKIEYEQLTSKTYDGKDVNWDEDKIHSSLNDLVQKRERLNEDLRINQEAKTTYKLQVEELTAKFNDLRALLDDDRTKLVNCKESAVRHENIMDNAKNKINETYKMAIDFAIENYQKELPLPEAQARTKINKLQSAIDNLGAINMEAIEELDVKQKRHDELYAQQQELVTAKDQVQLAINELDDKARVEFAQLIDKLNEELPKTFFYLFGGGSCQIRYTNPEDVLTTGIEVYANPPGKNVGNLMLLSGGEKTLVALSVLFSILKISAFPLVILDEAESALDPANVERFANIIRQACTNTQFIVITHRQGTMTKCDTLLGATMQTKGVTKMLSVSIEQAENYASEIPPEQGA
ncbi:AAA family ATPase [[Mycoplasma] testudinis]|uniref:AAA family ATPase n=1 Tax=[Mycoplasma] testudinis TaxID=33924 RepID=UPI000480E6A9|nr:AAA family ATPase [[Mycoplasma] testudinis]